MHDTGSTPKSGPFSKPRRQFLLTLFTIIYVMYGKVNFTNLSRYSDLSERTYRRHFEQPYEFISFNQVVIEAAIMPTHFQVGVVDPTFRPLNCHTQALNLKTFPSKTLNAHLVQKNCFDIILNSS